MNNKKILVFSAPLRLCGLTTFSPLRSLHLCGIFLFLALSLAAQIPQPKDVLGFTPGDDRKLASWAQTLDYFKKLDAASDRVQVTEIGKTTLGVPMIYAAISSPENLKNLEKYKQINAKLADPRTFKSNEATAKALIAEGKTIVLITCGVHSDEVGSELSSMLIAYKLASSNDPDIKKILDNTIILLVPSLNPDGVDIVKNWYGKTLGTPYEGTDPPELYNKYVGHDDNRDWYAFTQIETQLVVDKIHNVWHPQIVHDIHQQGEYGSRLFLPPYMDPVEPNVPKQIVEGYTELGRYMAADLRKQGFEGITTDSTYDAWTPSRAYSHYHGGVRILSETASCKLASPITVKFDQLRPGEHYDPRKEAANFGPVWKGGEWHIGDITRYMTTAAFSLLNNAADNREKWLSRFCEIGKEAIRPRKSGEVFGLFIPANSVAEESLKRAGVEIVSQGDSDFITMSQPYGSFAVAVLKRQLYPDLRDEKGNPIPPYDVTAHSLALLSGVTIREITNNYASLRSEREKKKLVEKVPSCDMPGVESVYLYKSSVPSMDEGWTRWSVKEYGWPFWTYPRKRFCTILTAESISDKDFRGADWPAKIRTIIFPDQSPSTILNGFAKGTMPDEYTGGVGKEGVENLKKFVEAGGTLVFLNRASDFAIDQFNLPIKDVTKGLPRKDFFIPGSILRTELDLSSPIAKGMPKESIAWFEGSPAFELTDKAQSLSSNGAQLGPVSVIARYPSDPKQILLSGWALGAEKIAGKAALVEIKMGKGTIILFGFRPQYRGQSLATFPLLFNAISN